MDNDIMVLIQFLSNKSYLTLKDIEMGINITRRQSTYRIEKLNQLLKVEKAPFITIGSSKDIQIPKAAQEAIETLLQKASESDQYYLSKKERMMYLYFMLFINMEYVSLQHFIELLGVSRSTILLDLKDLILSLEEHDVQIQNNRSKGYYLVGSEMKIRRAMMQYVISALSEEQHAKAFDMFIDDFHLDTFAYSRLVITELAQVHHIRFVEDRLVEFIYIFIFLKARMLSGIDAQEEIVSLIDSEVMSSMKEYEFSVDLLKNYKDTQRIQTSDVHYICSWILGISFGDIQEDTKDCVLISDIIGKIMTRFESLSGAHYKNTEDIFVQLYSHLRPAYYRLIFKLPIYNPLCEKVKEEYKELYQLVEETMKPFHILFGGSIPTGEIAYLTMHFSMIYNGKKDFEIAVAKRALVVCSNGIGSSAILYNELTDMFPDFHFLPPIESSRLQDFSQQVDIIFATNFITSSQQLNVPVIRVTPLMSTSERYQVVREVYLRLGSNYLKQPNVDVVMNLISKYADIRDDHGLYNELISYFSNIESQDYEDSQGLHLHEMIRKEIIRLKVEAQTWDEAVRKAYEPLVKEDFITQNYVEETIRCVQLSGPYIVITPHVALPHALPEAGAKACALGITVLKTPVAFGSKENDPVRYIFCLSAVDNHQHLGAMAELIELLNDEAFFHMLDTAPNAETILEDIKNRCLH